MYRFELRQPIPSHLLPNGDRVPEDWSRFVDGRPARFDDRRTGELRLQFDLGADGNETIRSAVARLLTIEEA